MSRFNENKSAGTQFSLKKVRPAVIAAAVIILLVIAAALLAGNDNYYIFTEKRIAEMETRFGITVTDDIELKKYTRENPDPLSCVYTLYADGIADHHDFMENYTDGNITLMEENGIRYDFDDNTQEKCDTGDFAAFYRYDYDTGGLLKSCDVYFYESENGRYSAEFWLFL